MQAVQEDAPHLFGRDADRARRDRGRGGADHQHAQEGQEQAVGNAGAPRGYGRALLAQARPVGRRGLDLGHWTRPGWSCFASDSTAAGIRTPSTVEDSGRTANRWFLIAGTSFSAGWASRNFFLSSTDWSP